MSESMVSVRVMSSGKEVDQIIRPLRTKDGAHVVAYRNRLLTVKNGCIHLDESDRKDPGVSEQGSHINWSLLVSHFLPSPLPSYRRACRDLLSSRFMGMMPNGVMDAVACLVAFSMESVARDLIVDFLRDNRESEKFRLWMEQQLLFAEKHSGPSAEAVPPILDSPTEGVLETDSSIQPEAEYEEELDWDWQPEKGHDVPQVDDSGLRTEALHIQETIGAYQSAEIGGSFVDFSEGPDGLDDAAILGAPPVTNAVQLSPADEVLVARMRNLGKDSLELLSYFADNPGDKALHAHQVLGFPVISINKALSGSLSHCVKRDAFGGWACHGWIERALEIMKHA